MAVVADHHVAAVREFSRSYTAVIGVLQEGLLRTPYSLTEARVIFELAQREATDVTELRRTLGLDAGYLSRILTRFTSDGLVDRRRSPDDARRQVVSLTRSGRDAYDQLDRRSAEQVRGLLGSLSAADQERLVGAMTTVRELLDPGQAPSPYLLRALRPGDLGWVVARHGALYAEEYGWDTSFEALVARIVAEYAERRADPDEHPGQHPGQRSEAWIAEVDGEPVGCVFCMRKDDVTAQLRLLLVEPRARGLGIGGRLVQECLQFARRAGYRTITLWTNDVLADARRLYLRAGFRLVDEHPHRSFGHDLVGQHWEREL